VETYDVLGRLLSREEVKAGGNVTLASYTYDYVGNIRTFTDGNANVTQYGYDTLGRLTHVTNAKNETTIYTYDMQGNLLTITYPDNNTHTKEYDELGRVIKETDTKGAVDKYAYDLNGNLDKRVDRLNQVFTFQHDNRNRLVTKISSDETIQYGYDAAGRRISMTDGTGTTIYDYGNFTGLLEKVTYPDSRTLQIFYNENGQRQQIIDPFGANLYYAYDKRNRLKSVGQTLSAADAEAEYTYYKMTFCIRLNRATVLHLRTLTTGCDWPR
jgi:YD repeat-containing protein